MFASRKYRINHGMMTGVVIFNQVRPIYTTTLDSCARPSVFHLSVYPYLQDNLLRLSRGMILACVLSQLHTHIHPLVCTDKMSMDGSICKICPTIG
jgi:hypothetical protein